MAELKKGQKRIEYRQRQIKFDRLYKRNSPVVGWLSGNPRYAQARQRLVNFKRKFSTGINKKTSNVTVSSINSVAVTKKSLVDKDGLTYKQRQGTYDKKFEISNPMAGWSEGDPRYAKERKWRANIRNNVQFKKGFFGQKHVTNKK